jgi:hypothetical protein
MPSLSAGDLRLWAARCARQAQDARSDEEVVRLLKMQAGLLELAEMQDWFERGDQSKKRGSA